MITPFLMIVLMTILGALGGFCFKLATAGQKLISTKFVVMFSLGGLLYLTAAIINIYVLKLLPYTVVFPLTSITYIWTLIISSKWLDEKVTKKKMIGVLSILLGAYLLVL
ncbi:EamA family transporter [Mesobacillus selenatarsenatis]|uniref:EamA family transporter n=1 Tax=Mesobacillus selenatarsenatis TaxID=388741 RepID=UPI0005A90218|nr:EamA family transporter [Mesobacillus selenatarsenatis]